MKYILKREDCSCVDAREILVRARREVTHLLNLQADLKRSINCDCGNCFVDITHFYNAMTHAIHAFEEAFETCKISLYDYNQRK